MRRLTAIAALVAVGLASAAMAGPPVDGVYDSTDLGGPTNLGRYTETWSVPGGNLMPGVVLNAESWDGMNLGTQWKYWCAQVVSPPVLLVDNVDANGNGNRTYMKTFVGGYIWLSGSGPWAGGDPDYPGVIDTYHEFETIQYANGQRVAAVTNIQATAHFDNYPASCLAFSVGNGSEVGSTDFGMTKPATYPAYLDPNTCQATSGPMGGWWDLFTLTLSIQGCTVPVEETTWGALKARYQ